MSSIRTKRQLAPQRWSLPSTSATNYQTIREGPSFDEIDKIGYANNKKSSELCRESQPSSSIRDQKFIYVLGEGRQGSKEMCHHDIPNNAKSVYKQIYPSVDRTAAGILSMREEQTIFINGKLLMEEMRWGIPRMFLSYCQDASSQVWTFF